MRNGHWKAAVLAVLRSIIQLQQHNVFVDPLAVFRANMIQGSDLQMNDTLFIVIPNHQSLRQQRFLRICDILCSVRDGCFGIAWRHAFNNQ